MTMPCCVSASVAVRSDWADERWAIFANPQHDYTRQLLDSVPGKQWEH